MLPSGPLASDGPRLFAKRAPRASLQRHCQPDTNLLLVTARAVMTGESVRPFGVQADTSGRVARLDLEASENWDANSRVFRPFASPGPTSLWHFKGSACEGGPGKRQPLWNDYKKCAVFFRSAAVPARSFWRDASQRSAKTRSPRTGRGDRYESARKWAGRSEIRRRSVRRSAPAATAQWR